MKPIPPYLRLVHSQPDEKRLVMVEMRSFNWPLILILAGCVAFHVAAIATVCSVVASLNQEGEKR